jgi:putative ATP-binding cassette transporter
LAFHECRGWEPFSIHIWFHKQRSWESTTITVPGYLVIAVIRYSILLSAATLLIARHLTRVMEENKRTEAELRSIGTHLRESGEGTALSDGKKDGRHTIDAALKAVIAIWRNYCWQLMRLTLITYTSLLITPVFGLLLCTPKYLQGVMTLGEWFRRPQRSSWCRARSAGSPTIMPA